MATIRREPWKEFGSLFGVWLKQHFERTDIVQTCISCQHFNINNETCTKATPPQRPPALVIANGCGQYLDAYDIPF